MIRSEIRLVSRVGPGIHTIRSCELGGRSGCFYHNKMDGNADRNREQTDLDPYVLSEEVGRASNSNPQQQDMNRLGINSQSGLILIVAQISTE